METLQFTAQRWENAGVRVWIQLYSYSNLQRLATAAQAVLHCLRSRSNESGCVHKWNNVKMRPKQIWMNGILCNDTINVRMVIMMTMKTYLHAFNWHTVTNFVCAWKAFTVLPRKFKGGIYRRGHLAITYGGELLKLQICFVAKSTTQFCQALVVFLA